MGKGVINNPIPYHILLFSTLTINAQRIPITKPPMKTIRIHQSYHPVYSTYM